jgi:hypothetical protein
MGAYLSVYRSSPRSLIDSMRVGTNGSGAFLVGQLIAGYAISTASGVDPQEARKARQHWLRYKGTSIQDLLLLTKREDAARAVADSTDGCGWVEVQDLDRKQVRSIGCPRLRALVSLWHMSETFWDLQPEIAITRDLLDGVKIGAEALESIDAAWAVRGREALDLLGQASVGDRLTLG